MNEPESFSVLLCAAQRGEAGALARLHHRYAPGVMARVRRNLRLELRRHYDTADLAQSVFVEVLRDLRGFEDRGEAAFRRWLYIKAENKVRMKLRSMLGRKGDRRVLRLDSEAQSCARAEDPLAVLARAEDGARARELLSVLTPQDRSIVVLRAQQHRSYAAIAQELRLGSADAARMRYARALVRLRGRWNGS